MRKEAAAAWRALLTIGIDIVASAWIAGVPLAQTLKVVGTVLVVGLVIEVVIRLGKAAEP